MHGAIVKYDFNFQNIIKREFIAVDLSLDIIRHITRHRPTKYLMSNLISWIQK